MDTNRMDFKRQTLLILIKLVTKIRLELPLQPQIKIAIPLKVRLPITLSEIENNNVVLGCCFFFCHCLPIYQTCLVITKKSDLRSYQKKSISNLPPIPKMKHQQNLWKSGQDLSLLAKCFIFTKLEFDLKMEISPFKIIPKISGLPLKCHSNISITYHSLKIIKPYMLTLQVVIQRL